MRFEVESPAVERCCPPCRHDGWRCSLLRTRCSASPRCWRVAHATASDRTPRTVERRGRQARLGGGDRVDGCQIGPGIDFYFAFGVIAVTAGIAAPLTIIVSAIAVFFLAFVVAEFTRMEPSAGSFITYVETSFGARAGVLVAWLVAVGFTVAIAGVFTMSGGMISLTLDHYTSWHPSWLPLALVATVGALALTLRGASPRRLRSDSRRSFRCSS